jgi:hypothetical protein
MSRTENPCSRGSTAFDPNRRRTKSAALLRNVKRYTTPRRITIRISMSRWRMIAWAIIAIMIREKTGPRPLYAEVPASSGTRTLVVVASRPGAMKARNKCPPWIF